MSESRCGERLRFSLRFSGRVQGVGFRYSAVRAARMYGVTGWVKNEPDGSVLMEAEGRTEEIEQVIAVLENERYISVEKIESRQIQAVGDRSFSVLDE